MTEFQSLRSIKKYIENCEYKNAEAIVDELIEDTEGDINYNSVGK